MNRRLLGLAVVLLAAGAVASAALLLPQDAGDERVLAPSATLQPTPTTTPQLPTRPMPPPTPTPDPVRNVPEVTVIDTENGDLLPLWEPSYRVHEVVFHEERVYFVRFQWPPGVTAAEIFALDLTTHRAQKVADGSNIRISVNGDIAYSTQNGGAILDRFGRAGPSPGGIGRFEWSPDGRWVTSHGEYGGDGVPIPLDIMDLQTGTVRQFAETLPCNCDGGPGVHWAPDSARFQFTRLAGVPGMTTPSSELYEPWGLTRVAAPKLGAWLDDTRYVVLPQPEGEANFIYDVVTGQLTPMPGFTRPSPNGRLFATSEGPAGDAFNVLDARGNVVLADLYGQFHEWSADSRYIVAGSGEYGPRRNLHVYEVSGNLVFSRERVSGSISPDGTKLAVVETRDLTPNNPGWAQSSDVSIVDFATRAERVVARDLRGGLGCAKWSAASRYVAITFCPGV